jgi:hypothetical protein
MACVAFDKQVAFCEEYAAEVHAALLTLLHEGPSEGIFKHTGPLHLLRQKHAVWLTPEIENGLERFERALREMGANAAYLREDPEAADRHDRVAAKFKAFADIMGEKHMGSEWEGQKLTEGLAIGMVIQRLRGILGTEELITMRAGVVTQALAQTGAG